MLQRSQLECLCSFVLHRYYLHAELLLLCATGGTHVWQTLLQEVHVLEDAELGDDWVHAARSVRYCELHLFTVQVLRCSVDQKVVVQLIVRTTNYEEFRSPPLLFIHMINLQVFLK